MLRLKIREVRVMTDVGHEGVGEETREIIDEVGWKRVVALDGGDEPLA